MLLKIFKHFFKIDPPKPNPKERPENWTITTDELFDQIKQKKRKKIEYYEMEWSKDYERTLYPKETVYPKKGYVYESLEDQEISYLTAWAAPYTGGGNGTILTGERIFINTEPVDEKPVGTYAMPIEYEKMEMRMVPIQERNHPKYGGFYFYIETLILNRKYKLVAENYEEMKKTR